MRAAWMQVFFLLRIDPVADGQAYQATLVNTHDTKSQCDTTLMQRVLDNSL